LQLVKKAFLINQITNAAPFDLINPGPNEYNSFDVISAPAEKGRKLSRRLLLLAWNLLKTGGRLYLAGAKNEGILSAISDAEALFGSATILAYKKGCRIVRLTKGDPSKGLPDWCYEDGIVPGTWLEFNPHYNGLPSSMVSLPGIFSAERLDEGSRLLLDNLSIEPGSRCLDLGCGHGVLGLYAASREVVHVDLVDVSLLGIAASNENIQRASLSNARALASDAYEAVLDQKYDLVISNPPFHTGHDRDFQITHAFLQGAWEVTQPGSKVIIVANKFLPYERQLKNLFRKVQELAETNRFHILIAYR
jgi:16S rRNA (guanine1207-N2)-methyltransferase